MIDINNIKFMPTMYSFKYNNKDYTIAFAKRNIEYMLSKLCDYKYVMTTTLNNMCEYAFSRSSIYYNVDFIAKYIGIDFLFLYSKNCYGKLTLYVVPALNTKSIYTNINGLYSNTFSSSSLSYSYVFSGYNTEDEYADNVIKPIFGGTLRYNYSIPRSTNDIKPIIYDITPKGISYIESNFCAMIPKKHSVVLPNYIYKTQCDIVNIILDKIVFTSGNYSMLTLFTNDKHLYIPLTAHVKLRDNVYLYEYMDAYHILYNRDIVDTNVFAYNKVKQAGLCMIQLYLSGIIEPEDIVLEDIDGNTYIRVNKHKCPTCTTNVYYKSDAKISNRKCAYCGKEQCMSCYTNHHGYMIYDSKLICDECVDTMGVSAYANI